MKLTIALLLLSVGVANAQTDNDIIKAFSFVESTHRVQIMGDGGAAWGKFQFHKARYAELGGQNWGSANEQEQDRVFANEIIVVRRLLQKDKYKHIDFVTALATYHNNGHIRNEQTKYVLKIYKAIREKK